MYPAFRSRVAGTKTVASADQHQPITYKQSHHKSTALQVPNNHLLFRKVQLGDVVEIRIPASSPVAENLSLFATKSRDFGILQFSVNGKPTGKQIDLYAAKPTPSEVIKLGAFEPADGAYILSVKVVGKNMKAAMCFSGSIASR